MNLREWQNLAHKAIRGGQDADRLFEGAENFHVYRQALWPKVYGLLREDFALLERLVGREYFHGLVEAFLKERKGYQADIGELTPAFVVFVEEKKKSPAMQRAARLGLLEAEARAARENGGEGNFFGLHSSARLLGKDGRYYAIWREEGEVRRERIREVDFRFLECFQAPAELAEISRRLERARLSPAFVQGSVAVWKDLDLIVSTGSLSPSS